MQATDFTRDDCLVGKKRHAYGELTGSWRCNECGGKLVMKWDEQFPENWGVMCARCGGTDFIHVYQLERQQWQAEEVLEGLPAELAQLAGYTPRVQRVETFVLNPEPLDI